EQPAPAADRLAALAAGAGATFRNWSAPDARFAVADDAGATRLISALAGGGIAVIEASPEEGRLERLFTGGAGAGPAAPAGGEPTPAGSGTPAPGAGAATGGGAPPPGPGA